MKAAETKTNLGERMRGMLLWNSLALFLCNSQSLGFSGEMKRNRRCYKQAFVIIKPVQSMRNVHSCVQNKAACLGIVLVTQTARFSRQRSDIPYRSTAEAVAAHRRRTEAIF